MRRANFRGLYLLAFFSSILVPVPAANRAAGHQPMTVRPPAAPALFMPTMGLKIGSSGLTLVGRDAAFEFHAGGVTVRYRDGETAEMMFVGADRTVVPAGAGHSTTRVTRFDRNGGTEVPAFTGVIYRDLKPGLDLLFTVRASRLLAEFRPRSGARGALPRLVWKKKPPAAAHIDETAKRGRGDGNGDDPARAATATGTALEIAYCGYLAFGPLDYGLDIAVDASGCAYVCGSAYGTDTPWRSTPLQGFIAKVRADGSALEYLSLFGPGVRVAAVAVDEAGCAHIAGTVDSSATLPVSSGPDLSFNGGGKDAFVAKLNPQGTGFLFCGYIGGAGGDSANAVALDRNGSLLVCGGTDSRSDTFPVRGGPNVTWTDTRYPYSDAWIAKVKADGSELLFCGYMGLQFHGGAGEDIAVDSHGDAYLCGQNTEDGWWAKVRGDSGQLVLWHELAQEYSADAICVDAPGNVYLANSYPFGGHSQCYITKYKAGDAGTRECNYSFSANGYMIGLGSVALDGAGHLWGSGGVCSGNGCTMIVVRLKTDGLEVDDYRVVGGAGNNRAQRLSVDANGFVYLVGSTESDEASFPVRSGPGLLFDRTPGNVSDAFVLKLAPPLGLTLQGTRNEQKSWLARRAYAELRLTIANPAGIAVAGYVLQRRSDSGAYADVQEMPAAVVSGSQCHFLDSAPPKAGAATYRVEARDQAGNRLGDSNEISI